MNIVEAFTALTEPSFQGGSSQSSSGDGFARRLDDVLADTRGRTADETQVPAEPVRHSETAHRDDRDHNVSRDNGDRNREGDTHERERDGGNDQTSTDDRSQREHAERPDREHAEDNSRNDDVSTSQESEARDADRNSADVADDNTAEHSETTNSDDPTTIQSADNGRDTGNPPETRKTVTADGNDIASLISGTSDPALDTSLIPEVTIPATPASILSDTLAPSTTSAPTGTADDAGLELATSNGLEALAPDLNTPVLDLLIPETVNPIVVPGLTETAIPEVPLDLSGAAFVAQAIASDDNHFVNPNSSLNGSTGQAAPTAAIPGTAAGSQGNGQAGGQAGGGMNFAPAAQANAGNAMNTPASNPDGFANFLESATLASAKATATPAALGQTGAPTASSGSETQSWQTPVSPATQPNGPAPTAGAQAATAPKPAFVPPQAPQVQVAVQIAQAVHQGIDQIKIQLHPAELGRVDVRLDVASDGRVAATVVADRSETLEMLRNDSRGLERALQDAGLRSDAGNLSFNLREQHHGQDDLADGTGNGKNGDGSELEGDGSELAANDAIHFNGPMIEGNKVFDIRV